MNDFLDRKNSLRRPRWDYSDSGYYYVTICTKNRDLIFGDIKDGIMGLNENGMIVHEMWLQIPRHFKGVSLGEFVVMPNHVHGIVIVDNPCDMLGAIHEFGTSDDIPSNVPVRGAINHAPTGKHIINFPMGTGGLGVTNNMLGAIHESPLREQKRRKMLISKIIGKYKMQPAKRINQMRGMVGEPLWQRNYYDHIIRDDAGLENITEYIRCNPQMWERDRNNPDSDYFFTKKSSSKPF